MENVLFEHKEWNDKINGVLQNKKTRDVARLKTRYIFLFPQLHKINF
jgi:hypothetical protein